MFFQRLLPALLFITTTYSYGVEETKFTKSLVNKSKTNSQAMNDLGDAYWFGNGVTTNKNKAISLYKKASLKGNVSSSIKLYQLNRTNMIQNADLVTAKEFLDKGYIDNLKSMNNGSEIAILRNIAFSDLPFHTYTNIKENIHSLESIKEKKSQYKSEILFTLGKQYLELSKYSTQNQDAKAISYIYESVQLNNYKAMLFLANAYENGDYGLITNPTKAQALRETAKKSNKNAFNFIYDGFYNFPKRL